jgi:hypothetical protein
MVLVCVNNEIVYYHIHLQGLEIIILIKREKITRHCYYEILN